MLIFTTPIPHCAIECCTDNHETHLTHSFKIIKSFMLKTMNSKNKCIVFSYPLTSETTFLPPVTTATTIKPAINPIRHSLIIEGILGSRW